VVGKTVKIEGVKSAWHYGTNGDIEPLFDANYKDNGGALFVRDGQIICVDAGNSSCGEYKDQEINQVVDLQGGSLAPGLTTYGSPLGLVEIRLEQSTNDGDVRDPLVDDIPSILGSHNAIIRAVDGLQFEGRNTLLVFFCPCRRPTALNSEYAD
jgi:imidazolonepropionase-like amidohydrolase